MHHSLSGRYIIDTGSARPLGHDGYPPGIIRLYYFFLRFFQERGSPTTSVIWMVRLLAITAGLGYRALSWLCWGIRHSALLLASLGAVFWAITPFFVERSRFATADMFMVFFSALALWLALADALWRRERWSTYATLCAHDGRAVQIHGRYHGAHLVAVAAQEWVQAGWRDGFQGSSDLVLLFNQLGRFAFSAWLIFLTPAFMPVDPNNPHEAIGTATRLSVGIPGPQTLLSILRTTLTTFDLRMMIRPADDDPGLVRGGDSPQPPPARGGIHHRGCFAGLLRHAIRRRILREITRFHSKRFLIHMTAPCWYAAGREWAIARALASWATRPGRSTLYTWLVRRLPRVRPWAGGLTLLLLFVVFLPQLLGSVGDLRESMKFDPRNLVRDYMDQTVDREAGMLSRWEATSLLESPIGEAMRV